MSSFNKMLGTLVVVVLKARHLKDSHTFYKQDPYAVIQLGNIKHQTKVEPKGGQHPVWDDEFRIDIYNQSSASDRKMKIAVYSKEYKEDQLIGEAEVDISETLKKGEFDEWIPLELNKSFRGEIYLEMTYYSAEPPPLIRRPSKLAPKDRLSSPLATHPKERISPYLAPPNTAVTSSAISNQPGVSSSPVAPPSPSLSHPSHAAPSHPSQKLPPSLQIPQIHSTHPSSLHVPKPPSTSSSNGAVKQLESSFHVPRPNITAMEPSHFPVYPASGLTNSVSPPLPLPKLQDPTLKNIPYLNVEPQPKPESASPKPLQHVPSVLRPTHVKSSPIPVQSRVPPQLPPRPQDPHELFRRQLEESDAEFAAKLAESEGLDLERIRMEEEDAELARRLAAEGDGDSIPGAWR